MTLNENEVIKRIREGPINYALLKLIHHEVGNGLAVLSGYRNLLQRTISAQAQESFPPTQDAWLAQQERCSGYLRIMQDREKRLNQLLLQLRELSPETTDEPLCPNKIRVDLVVLLEQVIEQRISLSPDRIVQVSIPTQPLFIMCDPFWLQVLLEHIFFNYIIVGHTEMHYAEIILESIRHPLSQEAKLTLSFRDDLSGHITRKDNEFEGQVRLYEQDEVEACLALCHEILREHEGQIWSDQAGSITLSLPLAD